ncbi:MAG: LacI family DNA-binding transcriptional regulator [Kiritimatiellia bacterium]
MKRKPVSLKDIADACGVSLMTVSRAVHGKFGVSPDVQRRVVACAEEMGYIPSRDLYQLADGKATMTVGFVIPHLADTIFPAIFEAIEGFFAERGWRVTMCCSHNSTIAEYRVISSLLELGVDGLLWCPVETDGYTHLRDLLRTSRKPLVFVDRRVPDFEADSVTVDDRAAMRRVVEHVLSRGAKRLAYLGAATNASWTARERLAGFREALAAAGVAADESLIVGAGSDIASGIRGMRRLLALRKRPDAVCCYNDPVALGAEKELLDRKVQIPQDCRLTGFSDTVMTELAAVPVTTVRQDAPALGREAAKLLYRRLVSKAPQCPIDKVIPTTLSIRAST